MKNNKLKLIVAVMVVLPVLALSNLALASEVTGNLTTGIGTTVEGIVITPPIASPSAGAYTSAQTVALSAPGATSIHYTTDGTTPTCTTGTVYSGSGPISVGSSMAIEAISCYPNNKTSTVASYAYTITIPAPAPAPALAPVSSGSGGGGGGGGGGGYYMPVITPAPANVLPSNTMQGQVLGAAAFNFTSNLKSGSRGNDVTELQKRLTQEGLYSGSITGYFGSLTLRAVKTYQLKHGLPGTGFVGPLTMASMNASQVAGVSTVNTEAIRAQIASLQAQVVVLLQQLLRMLQTQAK